jgi:hypothetical protein
VYQVDTAKDDVQQSFFLAESLKVSFRVTGLGEISPFGRYFLSMGAYFFLKNIA